MTVVVLVAALTRIFICLLVIAALMPLLPFGSWVVRLFDFPRSQFAILTLLPLAGLIAWWKFSSWSTEHTLWACIVVFLTFWQLWHVAKYSPLWTKELPDANQLRDDALTVTVVNLMFENQQKAALVEQLNQLNTDLLLLIEVDEAWNVALQSIEDQYPYRHGIVRDMGLGIVLWTRLPLINPETRHLVSETRASIFTKVELKDGSYVNFVGVHPTPPGLEKRDPDLNGRHDSRIRDAELMLVAKFVADNSDESWIVTGDFNDVAWSHTTRLFKRISGLKDPRIGRGLFNTYHTESIIMRVPIDQIFLSPGTEIVNIDRFRPVGSDHFGITTTFVAHKMKEPEPEVEGNDPKDAVRMIEQGNQDAAENGDATSEAPPLKHD